MHTRLLASTATPRIMWSECAVPFGESCRILSNYKISAIRPGACDHTAVPEIPPSTLETSKDGSKHMTATRVCLTFYT